MREDCESVTAVNPGEALRAASEVDGMLAFFCLLGHACKKGNQRGALAALKVAGLGIARAWAVVDGWEAAEKREGTTGFTAEAIAVSVVVHDVDDWRTLNWSGFLEFLAD